MTWTGRGNWVREGNLTWPVVTQGEEGVGLTFPGNLTLNLPLSTTGQVAGKADVRAYDVAGAKAGEDRSHSGQPTDFGYYKVIEVAAAAGSGCNRWQLVQLRQFKRKMRDAINPGQPWIQNVPPPGQDPDAWSVDQIPGHGPAYPPLEGAGVPPAIADGPGMPTSEIPQGMESEIDALFRTWVVCTDPKPNTPLGYIEWGFTMLVVGGTPRGTATITGVNPTWHAASDPASAQAQNDYNRIVNPQAYPTF
jgi:hypothetical protein